MSVTCDVKYLFFNLLDQDETDLTASSENSFYPVNNLKHAFSTKVYRSTSSSANIVVDCKTSSNVNAFAIRPDLENGFGFNGDLIIEGNHIDSWSSPSYSTTLSVNRVFDFGFKLLDNVQNFRYWRISGSGSSYFELSNLFIGEYFEAGRNPSFNWKFVNNGLVKTATNLQGQTFLNDYGQQKLLDMDIRLLNHTDMETLQNYIDYVSLSKPFWVIFDPLEQFTKDKDFITGMFYLNRFPKFTNIAFQLYNTSMTLKESK